MVFRELSNVCVYYFRIWALLITFLLVKITLRLQKIYINRHASERAIIPLRTRLNMMGTML